MSEPAGSAATDADRIGIVVIGRNEGARLARCLEAILPRHKCVVYADSGSTDGSVELARGLGAVTLSLDDSAPHTAARGRNAGFAVMRERFPDCELVQFVDGDCILTPDWMAQSAAFLEANGKAAIACGRRFEAHPEASLYNRLCDDEWNTPVGRADYCGGDSMMRVSALEQVGGFRPELQAGEEPELSARMRAAGWEIWRLDLPMAEHDAAMHRFSQWWRRAMRGGFGYAQVWTKTGDLPERFYGSQLRSAIFWALGVPLLTILAAVLLRRPVVLAALPALYAAQVFLIASRRDPRSLFSWQYAAMILLAKLPETIGALRFFLRGARASKIEYKEQVK